MVLAGLTAVGGCAGQKGLALYWCGAGDPGCCVVADVDHRQRSCWEMRTIFLELLSTGPKPKRCVKTVLGGVEQLLLVARGGCAVGSVAVVEEEDERGG